MVAGRIETYVHSDAITQNKGVAIVKVVTDTDFAARTDEFKTFAREAAMLVFGAMGHTRAFIAGATMWETVIAKFPDLETKRLEVERDLGETVKVTEMAILRL